VDVDGDGDLDAVVASLTDEERVLLNDGTGRFTHVPGSFEATGDSTLWFEFGDLNGDGRIDCATGQGESSFVDLVYFGTSAVPVDVRPPKFRAVEGLSAPASGGELVFHFAVSDEATTDEGPRLRAASARVTLVDGREQEVPASFMGGDLFRAVLPVAFEDVERVDACATDRAGNAACSNDRGAGGSTSSGSAGGGGAGGGSSSSGAGAGGAGGASGSGGSGAAPRSGSSSRVAASARCRRRTYTVGRSSRRGKRVPGA
jgi:hypothetical protein